MRAELADAEKALHYKLLLKNKMEYRINGSEQKLWVIGDSFTGNYHETKSWVYQLHQCFIGKKIYSSSKGSRDVQTVIDIFLRNLKDINSNDFVILMIPPLSRYRIPRKEPEMDVELHSEFRLGWQKMYHLDYFLGNKYFSSANESIKLVEEPFDTIDKLNFYQQVDRNLDINNINTDTILSLINSSNANINNMNSILDSFKKYFPFKIFIMSWVDELDKDIVFTKSQIIEKIGFWHTHFDEWKESEGQKGKQGDGHWSEKMDTAIADYIIVNFPEYFSYEYKEF